MINEHTIEAVDPLADKLARRGIRVTPIETTPVHQLAIAGRLDIPSAGPDEAMMDMADRILKGSRATDAFGTVRHDVVMDELVETISKTVQNNLNVARNVVNPIIREVTEEAETYMNDAEATRKTYISVVPDYYADVWNSPMLSEMVERYSETSPDDFKLRSVVDFHQSFHELVELAKTGAPQFDEEIADLFRTMGEDKVRQCLHRLFGKETVPAGDHFSQLVNTRGDRDVAILAHVFARSLLSDPPEGTGMNLQDYTEYMSRVISQSGRVIYQILRNRQADRNRRQLIRRYPSNLHMLGQEIVEIVVNADVYTDWLNDGGTPEVLMGSAVSQQVRSYSELLEQKDRFIQEWQQKERVLGTTQRLDRFNNAVDGLRFAIARQINELDDEQLLVPRHLLHERLEENLTKLYGHFYERMYEYARRLVCDILFPHTDALQILCAIDHVLEDYPDLEIREAALLATIEIVSEWVAKLCKVEHLRL